MALDKFPASLSHLLEQRKQLHLFRRLKHQYPVIDFSSNDYLGFSKNGLLGTYLKNRDSSLQAGSTGSRLISGNSTLFTTTEASIAAFHHAEAALIYNSGYDANLGLLSSVPQKGDLVITDELIHASLIDGVRLSFASHYKFRHNSVEHLQELLERHRGNYKEIYVVVESVYSMDGDEAPLPKIAALCENYSARLIVDEAHAIGVFGEKGRGLCYEPALEQACFARVYTYGKAMGCHGAAICGSSELRDFLINFSRSFIYTTAMPEHSLQLINAAYQLLSDEQYQKQLRKNIDYFKSALNQPSAFIESNSAIHCMLISGNENAEQLENKLAGKTIFAKAVKSPTVKEGQERIRICLHAFNTKEEIDLLVETLQQN